MKAIFIAEDDREVKNLAKANDMAGFIFELKHNAFRRFKHTDYDYSKAQDMIFELLEDFNLNDHIE